MSAPPCVERMKFEDKHLHFRLTSGHVKSGELTILCNVVSLLTVTTHSVSHQYSPAVHQTISHPYIITAIITTSLVTYKLHMHSNVVNQYAKAQLAARAASHRTVLRIGSSEAELAWVPGSLGAQTRVNSNRTRTYDFFSKAIANLMRVIVAY